MKTKNRKYHYLNYKPTFEEKNEINRYLVASTRKYAYKRLKSGKYKAYCSHCGKYMTISLDTLRQVQASKLCPNCFQEVITTTRTDDCIIDLVKLEHDGEIYGYRAVVNWQFGKQPKLTKLKQVLLSADGKWYRKDIVKNMYSIVDTVTDGWRRCNPYVGYETYFRMLPVEREVFASKRAYYESLELDLMPLKSNQKKLIQDNLFNLNQILYIVAFDLKSVKEVLKYRSYMKSNNITYYNVGHIKANVYFLDYIYRNKINIDLFADYIDQCKQLKVKLDKPKDFHQRHGEYALRLLSIKDEKTNDSIIKKAKRNKNKTYMNDNIQIVPCESVQVIHKIAKDFHNCIANYIDDYAHGRTNLYHMDIDGNTVVAIEVKGKELRQAYQLYNKPADKEQMKHIRRWCKNNAWKIALDR